MLPMRATNSREMSQMVNQSEARRDDGIAGFAAAVAKAFAPLAPQRTCHCVCPGCRMDACCLGVYCLGTLT